jgi:hypothetical protein
LKTAICILLLLLCSLASAQTANVPFSPPMVVFLGSDGRPLANGTVQTFQANTTIPLGTFASANAVTPQSANLTLNAGGGAQIWLGASCYKFVVKNSSGVLQWSADQICATNLGSVPKIVSNNCASSLVATAGFLELCNQDFLTWRNVLNTANISLAQAGSATVATGNLPDVLRYGSNSTGALQARRYLDFSAAPAQSGVLASGNNVCEVAARNAAGNADVCAVQVDANNLTDLGGSAGVSLTGPAVSASSYQGTAFQTANANPAQAGVLRCANNQQCVFARNAANSADSEIASVLSDNSVRLADAINTPANIVQAPHLKVTGGIVNSGPGLMHMRFASCTTPASANSGCNTTVTWPGTWPDTSYTVVCTADKSGSPAGFFVESIFTKTTTQVSVTIQNSPGSSTATSGAIDCVGIRD